ncbi:MAG: TIGR03790 family protein [Pseudomonadota bacterium]|nr:TIGR03790 family protein [Pseudomonadota bacterium]
MSSPLQLGNLILKTLTLLALCATALPGIASNNIHLLLPKHRIYADELAVIVNDADPLSVRISQYYQKSRNIPATNILHVSFEPGRATMGRQAFERIRASVIAETPKNVQAYALTWAEPYRVECMSITSAFTFGFDKAFCSKQRCAATRNSPVFNNPTASPYTDYGIRPTISIAAASFEQARALIDRGIRADNSQPGGAAYLLSTTDKARNVRSVNYETIERRMAGWIASAVVESNGLKNTEDILFYFTGIVRVPYLETLKFVPGAIADHLTSAGGRLSGSGKQMSALRWLEAGATGSYGTVVEPCNLLGKFPSPGLVMESYGSGRTLLEAYWQSVQQPGEGIFIGEPLAAPFDGYDVEQQQDSMLLRTRILLPGLYRLSHAENPVGPYRALPGFIKVAYHQRDITLPKSGPGYYRLERLSTTRTDGV